MSNVTIVPDSNGNVIRQSNNPEYGHVRLEQERIIFNGNWVNRKVTSTLIQGKLKDLVAMGFDKMTSMKGKIVVRESLEPFNATNPERDLKIAGDTGVVCRVDDQPIYRTTFFSSNENEEDVFIQHTNGDEIRQANLTAPEQIGVEEFEEEDSFTM